MRLMIVKNILRNEILNEMESKDYMAHKRKKIKDSDIGG